MTIQGTFVREKKRIRQEGGNTNTGHESLKKRKHSRYPHQQKGSKISRPGQQATYMHVRVFSSHSFWTPPVRLPVYVGAPVAATEEEGCTRLLFSPCLPFLARCLLEFYHEEGSVVPFPRRLLNPTVPITKIASSHEQHNVRKNTRKKKG